MRALLLLIALASIAGPASAADMSGYVVAGLRLGMPLDDALAVVERAAADPGSQFKRNVRYTFYNCAARTTHSDHRVYLLNGFWMSEDLTPQTVPAGVCVDTAYTETANGSLRATFLLTVPGDSRSQVVARIQLGDRIPDQRRGAHEVVAVKYYEERAIARYGPPTYRDAFRAHHNVAPSGGPQPYVGVGGVAIPVDLPSLCNLAGCLEHEGMLAWCPSGTPPSICAKPSILPDDDSTFNHYFSPHVPIPEPSSTLNPDATYEEAHAFDRAATQRGQGSVNRSDAKRQNYDADQLNAHPYALRGHPPVSRRLTLTFIQVSNAATLTLEDEALFAKTFGIVHRNPQAVATPAF